LQRGGSARGALVALRVAHCPLSTTFKWPQLHSLLSPTPQRANAAP
jgi:hypothetical protein